MASARLYKRLNGRYAFASTTKEWFNITPTHDNLMTPGEIMSATGMDAMVFSEHKVSAHVDDYVQPDGQRSLPFDVPMEHYKAVLLEEVDADTSKITPAGIVGATREVLQFSELLEPAHRVIDISGGHVEAGGLVAGASSWFFFIRLPEEVTIGGDKHAQYLMCRDGLNTALTVSYMDNRLWCFNMFPAALASAKSQPTTYRLLHRKGAKVNVSAVRDVMQIGYESSKDLDEAASVLLSSAMDGDEFLAYTDTIFGVPEHDAGVRARNNYRKRRNELLDIFTTSETVDTTYRDGKPTRWTAYQALTEYLDHRLPIRGHDQARRVERWIGGTYDPIKREALEALR